jgi:nucleoside-diphosphate-sugar epimerase
MSPARMRTPVVLITGASGEIGHGLIDRLARNSGRPIVTLDLKPLDSGLASRVAHEVTGSILDTALLDRLLAEFETDVIIHLAALLSTRAEFSPMAAHQVNVGGTLNLLEFAMREAESHGRPVMFLYPSSIAVYGLPDLPTKQAAGKVAEDEWLQPTTMYGCNKLYCEQLGRYYSTRYKQLSATPSAGRVDFRAIRFPGLLSNQTMPSGGTSDFGSEMLHQAAAGRPYPCFVRPDTQIPFMAMPDAVDALLALGSVPRERLTRSVYNVGAFAPTAEEFRTEVLRVYPDATITYEVDLRRQGIVDSWPADLQIEAARRDFDFAPKYGWRRLFDEYFRIVGT